MKTITLPVYNRPERLAATLGSLKANRTEGYRLFVLAEPGCPAVREVIRSVDFMPVCFQVNEERLGLQKNVARCVRWAMGEGSEFNVYLEDDVILAPDALDMAEWFRERNRDAEYACLSLLSFDGGLHRPDQVLETQDIQPWGLCWTDLSWQRYVSHGFSFRWPIEQGVQWSEGWDFWLGFYLRMCGHKNLRPACSRAKHVGYNDGTHPHEGLWSLYESVALNPRPYRGPYALEKLPENTWSMARSESEANLMAMV